MQMLKKLNIQLKSGKGQITIVDLKVAHLKGVILKLKQNVRRFKFHRCKEQLVSIHRLLCHCRDHAWICSPVSSVLRKKLLALANKRIWIKGVQWSINSAKLVQVWLYSWNFLANKQSLRVLPISIYVSSNHNHVLVMY